MRMPEGSLSSDAFNHDPDSNAKIERFQGEIEEAGNTSLLQRKPDSSGGELAGGSLSETVRSPGSGAPLHHSLQSRIGRVLNADLSHVRVHDDIAAQQSAKHIHAKAFTYQNHIFLAKGQSREDISLVAHEAAHVIQQGQKADLQRGVIQRQPENPVVSAAPAEILPNSEADEASESHSSQLDASYFSDDGSVRINIGHGRLVHIYPDGDIYVIDRTADRKQHYPIGSNIPGDIQNGIRTSSEFLALENLYNLWMPPPTIRVIGEGGDRPSGTPLSETRDVTSLRHRRRRTSSARNTPTERRSSQSSDTPDITQPEGASPASDMPVADSDRDPDAISEDSAPATSASSNIADQLDPLRTSPQDTPWERPSRLQASAANESGLLNELVNVLRLLEDNELRQFSTSLAECKAYLEAQDAAPEQTQSLRIALAVIEQQLRQNLLVDTIYPHIRMGIRQRRRFQVEMQQYMNEGVTPQLMAETEHYLNERILSASGRLGRRDAISRTEEAERFRSEIAVLAGSPLGRAFYGIARTAGSSHNYAMAYAKVGELIDSVLEPRSGTVLQPSQTDVVNAFVRANNPYRDLGPSHALPRQALMWDHDSYPTGVSSARWQPGMPIDTPNNAGTYPSYRGGEPRRRYWRNRALNELQDRAEGRSRQIAGVTNDPVIPLSDNQLRSMLETGRAPPAPFPTTSRQTWELEHIGVPQRIANALSDLGFSRGEAARLTQASSIENLIEVTPTGHAFFDAEAHGFGRLRSDRDGALWTGTRASDERVARPVVNMTNRDLENIVNRTRGMDFNATRRTRQLLENLRFEITERGLNTSI